MDVEDVPLVAGFNWCASISRRRDGSIRAVYAMRNNYSNGKRVGVLMHRVIIAAPVDLQVDHIDGNGLNNRRANMRLATRAENNQNCRSRVGSSSKYLGVCWHKRAKRWKAQIMIDGVNKYLGLFTCEIAAARAYDAEATIHHGEYARLNFPLEAANQVRWRE
jgi:HNH endonuclease/AP2 domain